MLCKPHKFKDNGQAVRKPVAELRRLGKRRKLTVGLGGWQLDR